MSAMFLTRFHYTPFRKDSSNAIESLYENGFHIVFSPSCIMKNQCWTIGLYCMTGARVMDWAGFVCGGIAGLSAFAVKGPLDEGTW